MRTLVGTLALAASLTVFGAVGRQALHLGDHGPLVGWTCPHCGSGNAGSPEARFRAACRKCSGRFSWDVVAGRTPDGRIYSSIH